ncbi:hypothetical protein C0993_000439 [Termitomyces sp. T159_Od127]|nr:hypothetical protein C0993_000439 [Termitomyces sp. T159_Od127]
MVATSALIALTAPKAPGMQKVLESGDEEMGEVSLMRDKMAPSKAGGPAHPPLLKEQRAHLGMGPQLDYGELQSEEEEEEEEGKTPAQHFQCIQQNKKIAKKKANQAKAAAALVH